MMSLRRMLSRELQRNDSHFVFSSTVVASEDILPKKEQVALKRNTSIRITCYQVKIECVQYCHLKEHPVNAREGGRDGHIVHCMHWGTRSMTIPTLCVKFQNTDECIRHFVCMCVHEVGD